MFDNSCKWTEQLLVYGKPINIEVPPKENYKFFRSQMHGTWESWDFCYLFSQQENVFPSAR